MKYDGNFEGYFTIIKEKPGNRTKKKESCCVLKLGYILSIACFKW